MPTRQDCIRVVVAVCLMADDPELVLADVLSKDRLDYERTGDRKYVDRAHRRGKVGWLIGAHVEVDPHYRRPHFAIRWTGKAGRCRVWFPSRAAWSTGAGLRASRRGESTLGREDPWCCGQRGSSIGCSQQRLRYFRFRCNRLPLVRNTSNSPASRTPASTAQIMPISIDSLMSQAGNKRCQRHP